MLHRQLKTKELRGLVVRCLMQLIMSYLVRYGKVCVCVRARVSPALACAVLNK